MGAEHRLRPVGGWHLDYLAAASAERLDQSLPQLARRRHRALRLRAVGALLIARVLGRGPLLAGGEVDLLDDQRTVTPGEGSSEDAVLVAAAGERLATGVYLPLPQMLVATAPVLKLGIDLIVPVNSIVSPPQSERGEAGRRLPGVDMSGALAVRLRRRSEPPP